MFVPLTLPGSLVLPGIKAFTLACSFSFASQGINIGHMCRLVATATIASSRFKAVREKKQQRPSNGLVKVVCLPYDGTAEQKHGRKKDSRIPSLGCLTFKRSLTRFLACSVRWQAENHRSCTSCNTSHLLETWQRKVPVNQKDVRSNRRSLGRTSDLLVVSYLELWLGRLDVKY